MAVWRQQQRALEFVSALVEGGNRLIRRRPIDLTDFLVALDSTSANELLATPEGQRDATVHLGTTWQETARVLAQPDTLPEVVEHRNRVRVHPAAPWLTAGVAAAGSGIVVAGSAPAAVEVFAVGGVAVVTALGAGWSWRPRVSRTDRSFTVSGAAAIAARAQVLVGQQTSTDPECQRSVLRLHALVAGGAEDVRAAEDAARTAGLLDDHNTLVGPAQASPAHRALVDEVVLQRAELVQSLFALQRLVLRVDEQERRSRRTAYRRLLDDPLDDL
ncbi:hypothetical protein ASG90_07465 [Nocardioides sp. Soil797]|nr:hypothetical protein ASG90_07465 [Nocardioides sp. Soil797]